MLSIQSFNFVCVCVCVCVLFTECQDYVASVIYAVTNMDHWQNDTDRKTEVLGGTPVGVQLCLPQVPCGLAWD